MDSQSKSKEAALKRLKKTQISIPDLWERILNRDKVALGQAISLLESQLPAHRTLANELIELSNQYAVNNHCFKIGITGVPGVGKSTFVNVYTQLLLEKNQSVAILAVDPSSQQSGGSILGDKTRMTNIFAHPDVFIRPSPSGKHLGGVAHKTREVILLCEAAGFDNILVETVGVGQSETAVYEMTDLFILLMLPGAGDELQGIKRGIMELADILVVHKADGENLNKAKIASSDYKRALHLFPPTESGWIPCVLMASSEPPQGLKEIDEKVEAYFHLLKTNGYLLEKRKKQRNQWFIESMELQLLQFIKTNPDISVKYQKMMDEVNTLKISPQIAAQKVIELIQIHGKR
ncbi:MAG TPA: methylmalonyl Co-A mutase-associated GTPase MeaB [Chitinophagales bacterium]|nr:methylmalonyl Co-A mutase-associated GTPase MeaB [Chitinophagales bacterium]